MIEIVANEGKSAIISLLLKGVVEESEDYVIYQFDEGNDSHFIPLGGRSNVLITELDPEGTSEQIVEGLRKNLEHFYGHDCFFRFLIIYTNFPRKRVEKWIEVLKSAEKSYRKLAVFSIVACKPDEETQDGTGNN